MSNVTTQDDVLQAVDQNHIWINAFTLINPSDKTALAIGRQVIRMLKQSAIPSLCTVDPESPNYETFVRLSELTKTLYLRVNAS